MKAKPILKKLFFIHIPIYGREISVIVGMTHKEAIISAKRQKCTKDFIKILDDDLVKEGCDRILDPDLDVEGSAVRVKNRLFLVLPPFKNNWDYLDMLNHEVFHLIQFVGQPLNIWDDVEPPAYLHSWLFRQLRRALSGNK